MEEADADVDQVVRWAANVGLLGRAMAIARKTGASAEELYGVAEQQGLSRAELDALLVDPVGSGQ